MENYFEYYKIIFSSFSQITRTRITILFVLVVLGMSYYFLNYKSMNAQLKVLIFILLIGGVWLVYSNVKDEKKTRSIILNHSLTTGKIDRHIISTTGYKSQVTRYGIEYSYLAEGKIIQNRYYENAFVNVPEEKPNLEIEYLVIYEKGNPKNSFILLNYPLIRQGDFEKYEKMFAEGIPKDVFRRD